MIYLTGLPKHLENYSLVVFYYFATGEGITNEIQLLCHPNQKLDVGWEGFNRNIIPAIIEKTVDIFGVDNTYFDWNPEFKAQFFGNFGPNDWEAFTHCCVDNKGHLNLIKKSHFNLS